jgi:hypothetical protein
VVAVAPLAKDGDRASQSRFHRGVTHDCVDDGGGLPSAVFKRRA